MDDQVSAVRVELPILVYRDDGRWVAQSLMTSTISVQDTPVAAAEEVCRLLVGEIVDALEDSKGDLDQALDIVSCLAPPALWRRFYAGAKPLRMTREPERTSKLPQVDFMPRETGELTRA